MSASKVVCRLDPQSIFRHIVSHPDLRAIILCADGLTSSTAAAALRACSVRYAASIIGGFEAWTACRLPREVEAHWYKDLSYPVSDEDIVPDSEGEEELRLSKPPPWKVLRHLYQASCPFPYFPGGSTIWVEVLAARCESGRPTGDEIMEVSRFEYLRRSDQGAVEPPRPGQNLYWAMRPWRRPPPTPPGSPRADVE